MQKSTTKPTIADLIKGAGTIAALLVLLNGIVLTPSVQEILKKIGSQSAVTFLLFIVQEIIFIIPVIAVAKKYKMRLLDLGLKPVRLSIGLKYIFAGFGIVWIVGFIVMLIENNIGIEIPGFRAQSDFTPLFGTEKLDTAIAVLVLLIIAPIIEEFIFRGFMLQTLLRYMQPPFATLIVATIFAFIHFQFQSFGIILILALVINWIFLKTQSIVPTIGFHIINNTFAFIIQFVI